METIFLIFLASFFLYLILWYFSSVIHGKTKLIEGNRNLPVSMKSNITPKVYSLIQMVLEQTTFNPDVKITELLKIPEIQDNSKLLYILNDKTGTSSSDIIEKFEKELNINISSGLLNYGLIIYYPLNALPSDGKTILNQASILDSTGKPIWIGDPSYNGLLFNGTLDYKDYRGTGNASLKFNGNGNSDGSNGTYIKIPILPTFYDGTNQFTGLTVAFWFKGNPSSRNTWARIFDFGFQNNNSSFSYNNNNLIIVPSLPANGNLSFYNGATPDNSIEYSETNADVMDNTWRHIVVTIDTKGNQYIYVNGLWTNGNLYPNSLTTNINQNGIVYNGIPNNTIGPPKSIERNSNYIGRSNWAVDPYLNGNMADLRIYNKEMAPEVVQMLYKSQYVSIDVESIMNQFSAINSWWGIPLNAKLDSRKMYKQITADPNNNHLIWKGSWPVDNYSAIASDTSVFYCSQSEKITVPVGSFMTITPSNKNQKMKFEPPFTIMVVANIYSFSNASRNILIAAQNWGGIELTFYNNQLNYGCVGQSEEKLQLNSTMGVDTLKENAINIFTFTCDENGNFNAYINSNPINKTPVKMQRTPANQPITFGCALVDGRVFPSNNSIDYYNFMHWGGILNKDSIEYMEWYYACRYNIKESIHSSNKNRRYNFT